jgi:hypothetical protein
MLTDRHASLILGTLSCFDRVLVMGTLPDICHAEALARELSRRRIRFFDYKTAFAQPLRDEIRAHTERLAQESGIGIEHIRSIKAFRKEDRVQEVLAERGTHPGLVHIFSALETCTAFEPWHDRRSGKTFLRPDSGKCLHYYFYFIDPDLGLCHLRVPTWAPFRLQFCFNGHNWLVSRLKRLRIGYRLVDNAFVSIDDFALAQRIADRLKPSTLHRKLDRFARHFCPAAAAFPAGYHWSIMQLEYATDIVFKSRSALAPIYEHLVRSAVHAVRAEHVATFLGRKLDPRYQGEIGNDFNTRIQGTRIRHHMGPVALKMYDKFGCVLRIETVANDVSFFKHHRTVEHRDGTSENKLAPVKKTIYSLAVLPGILGACNRRYLEFLSSLDDDSAGRRHLDRLARPVRDEKRSYRGINFFDPDERDLLLTIARGEFNIAGFQVRNLRRILGHLSSPQLSRRIKRLLKHRLIKKVSGTYRYYLTRLGRRVISAAFRLREGSIIPALADLPA